MDSNFSNESCSLLGPPTTPNKSGQEMLDRIKAILTNPTGAAEYTRDELLLARHILEVSAFGSIEKNDLRSFEYYMAQLKLIDHKDLPGSPFQKELKGLHFLAALCQNRTPDFQGDVEYFGRDVRDLRDLRRPEHARFAEAFLASIGSPLAWYLEEERASQCNPCSEPLQKKQKRNQSMTTTLELLKSILILLRILPRELYSTWDSSSFIQIAEYGNEEIRWLAVHCIASILSVNDDDMRKLKRKFSITTSVDEQLAFDFQIKSEYAHIRKTRMLHKHLDIHFPIDKIVELNPRTGLTSIGGVLVFGSASANSSTQVEHAPSALIRLDSTISYLREISLSASAKFKPICLLGGVGVGKTSLLKNAGCLFGKKKYPEIISVQMSDQIDSRLLLGSYHSTDLPGQFVWKPGCLTKALLNGYWIIMEDLDSAPSDVLTLLSGLIDTRKLNVPGYGEITKPHPDFRILATVRVQRGKRTDKLGKQWKKLVVQSPTEEELKLLISTQFPHLRPILDRLLHIFQSVGELNLGTSTRVVSLRDFLKFCVRIPNSLDFTQNQSAIMIFQESLDLFTASFSSSTTRREISESLGTHMGLLNAKVEYFCSQYKPHIRVCTNSNSVTAGRFTIPMFKDVFNSTEDVGVFSTTRRASCLMEMICGSVKHHEPVLLIGETGVGKTSCVQYLAKILRQNLVVVNLNRQSDSGDLLGGYKPVELKFIFGPVREEFEHLFGRTFSKEANKKFMRHIMTCFANKRWFDLVKLMVHVQKEAVARGASAASLKDTPLDVLQRWVDLGHKLSRIEMQVKSGEESPFAFSFIEGTLISAIKKGHWVLLDEINLATPEMLQCLSGILDKDSDIHLWEKGDERPIVRNPNFHLFAAMNPSTDVGKKDLPLGLRNRFTEFYVEELTDPNELQVLVSDYLRELSLPPSKIENIVEFYLEIRSMSHTTLVDGVGKKPHFSLRTLCRALKISALNLYGSISRSLYESFCLSFLTQLDFSSHPTVQALIAKFILGKTDVKSIINQPLPRPSLGNFVQVEGYWIPQGDKEPKLPESYILTSSIRRNLKDLARIVSAGKLPVLIQGETSVGKTSLIQYLADITGNNCYRINNHQHTDLQEYAGSYQSDQNGKLIFTEGVLVQAMRKGEWIILDELNLAPSEVMEALNRLLDDNRQLFLPETGQTVPAHPRFMLFATQNPPGLYGGRKLLSRAFRNRFVELHFDEIPSAELERILHLRCAIPESYCKKIIGVLRELQVRRRSSAALEGKHGFATLRDLFRWAERYRLSGEQKSKFYDWDQHLADEGFLVLAGKVRKSSEEDLIREVMQKHLKRDVDPNNLFSLHEKTSTVTKPILQTITGAVLPEFKHIVWTFQMRRLAVLVGNALRFKEPVLIVGETGCGKTSIVQLLTLLFGQKLYSVNCHMHSEGSDFLGGLRPVRNHQIDDERLFEWVDGPLVEAMESGGVFMADEISLADDSVLERVNSVLEPERTLLIAEKGDETPRLVVADKRFHFIGTMNPGGDYGKKELSPALRNRLTEIWCQVSTDPKDLEAIIEHNLEAKLRGKGLAGIMLLFVAWLKNNQLGHRCVISIRDYLAWVEFINHCYRNCGNLISLTSSVHHGACLAFLDGLGSSTTSTENTTLSQNVKLEALSVLKNLTVPLSDHSPDIPDFTVADSETQISVGPFGIPKNPKTESSTRSLFHLEAPTTSQNALRVLRAMQLNKPILLEGSPGVGKTALVSALAQICGYSLVRINLSEQTDISDLFGADLPVEGGTGGQFAWRDGPLLQALKNSSWILLDELNLASQSVLEGLNACLDHRGEIYVPELNRTFKIGTGAEHVNKVIACQNPLNQGGARKGLPKSFLNRFTQVFMDPLSITDLQWILQASFPSLPHEYVQLMATFAEAVMKAVCQLGLFGAKGSPWDFNLRDLIRWAELMQSCLDSDYLPNPSAFVDLIYGLRMRSVDDRQRIEELFRACLANAGCADGVLLRCGTSGYHLLTNKFICGNGSLIRGSEIDNDDLDQHLLVLQKQLPALEGLTVCLQMGWMPILVGPTGAGKTSLFKLLSRLSGHRAVILTVSPEMDTIDLLGGFEQADIYRKIDEMTSGLREIMRSLVKATVCQMGNKLDSMDFQLLDIWSSVQSLLTLAPEGEVVGNEEEMKKLRARVDFLQTSHLRCKCLLGEMKTTRKTPEARKLISKIVIAEEGLEQVSEELKQIWAHLDSGIQTGAFQWVDSLLIKAIVKGHWLLIDGANRCSAAVLDRLNSLMEPNGSLFMSERGSIDGKILQIKPHPDFRLILALDPAHGEISRAMRNRGVEIFMPGPEEEDFLIAQNNDGDGDKGFTTAARILGLKPPGNQEFGEQDFTPTKPKFNLFDLDSILRAEGIPNPHLRNTLINLHEQIQQTVGSYLGDRPTIHHLVESVRSFQMEMKFGIGVDVCNAIRSAFMSTYVLANSQLLDSQLRRSQLESILRNANLDLGGLDCSDEVRIPLSVQNFINDQLFRVWKHMDVLLHISSERPLAPIANILGSCQDKKLLQLFVVAEVFLRIKRVDTPLFISALSIKGHKLVEIQNFCVALAETLGSFSNSQDDESPRDLHSSPSFLTGPKLSYSPLKLSLRIHYHLLKTRGLQQACNKQGTLGFISQAVNRGTFSGESLKYTQFLANFSSLVENFDRILTCDLSKSGNAVDMEGRDHVAGVWKNGVTSLLWRQRLVDLCGQEWNCKSPNERLVSNVALVIAWIGDQVVPFLKEISDGHGSSAQELQELGVKCLDVLDHFSGENREYLSKSHMMRELILSKPFDVTSVRRAEFISSVMEIISEVWSLKSYIPPCVFIAIFNSAEGIGIHTIIARIMRKIIDGDNFSEADEIEFQNSRDELSRLRKLHEVKPACDISGGYELKEALAGLHNYLRICDNRVNSALVNPVLCALSGSQTISHLQEYFSWEDHQRFLAVHLANNSPRHFLNLSGILPYFVSKIIVEDAGSFRISSLGSRNVTNEVMADLNAVLSNEILRPITTEKTLVRNFAHAFSQILKSMEGVLGNECQIWMTQLNEEAPTLLEDITTLGSILANGGASMMTVSKFMPIVDPAVEKKILAGYLQTEISFFETWLQAQRIHQYVELGSDLLYTQLTTLHPFVSACATHIQQCQDQLIEAQTGIAFRPDPPNYAAINKDIVQFVRTFASIDKIQEMVDRVQKLLASSLPVSSQDIEEALTPCQIWIESHRNFVGKLAIEFWYWDVVLPFLFSSVQVSAGLSFLCDAIYRFKSVNLKKEKDVIFEAVQFPIAFRTNDTSYTLSKTQNLIFSNKLFLATLISFMNEVETDNRITACTVGKLHALTSEVQSLWIAQEEERERKRELEDAMYTYKGHERAMELSEEEQDVADLANTFPSFEDEFKDVQASVSNTLDGSEKDGTRGENQISFFNEDLTRENITIFFRIQASVLNRVKTHWMYGSASASPALDFVTPFLHRFEVGSGRLSDQEVSTLDDVQNYIPGALVAVHNLQNNTEPTDFFRATQLYDIYHDPNIDEVQKLNSILSGLRMRVNVLLRDWPGHPALQKIIEVVDRIESFRVDCSLMKFLTGLELLLGFAQEWESCAHQGVSVAIHLAEITEVIIAWRKLELQCWKNLLAITFQKEQNECHKWWCHLYAVVMEMANREEQSTGTAKEFLQILHQFLESSPIGQFETRLSFLRRIHCHLICLEQFDTEVKIPKFVHAYIWNTFCYYQQFSDAVSVKLGALRSITEKKLKDFVKISRWNDANYYALKDSVQKSQRTLAKLVKEWRKTLQTPVSTVLIADLNSNLTTSEVKKLKSLDCKPLRTEQFLTPKRIRQNCRILKETVDILGIKRLKKLKKCFDIIQMVSQNALTTGSRYYSEEIGKLEELTVTIIETSHDLQNLEVTEEVHEKRKKLLHNIHARRRAALADLFRVLKEAQLSYRGGLIQLKQMNGTILHDFSTQPVDIEAGWKHLLELHPDIINPADKILMSSWNGCEAYFQKCLSRIAVMMKAFGNPSKELGPTINDRCKGFVVDLMTRVSDQKKLIAKVSENLWCLKILTSKSSAKANRPSMIVFDSILNEASRIEYETKQLAVLIDAMTDSNIASRENLNTNLKFVLDLASKLKNLIRVYSDTIYEAIFSRTPGMTAPPEAGETLKICKQYLQQIHDVYENMNCDSVLGQLFSKMTNGCQDFIVSLTEEDVFIASTDIPLKFTKASSTLLKKILLTFQNLDKCQVVTTPTPAQENNEISPPRLPKDSVPELQHFDLNFVTTRARVILGILEESKHEYLGQVVDGLVPLLRQFTMAGQFYLTVLVQYHRSTCKLLSVLSGIFATLGSKGFCLPADYEDEAVAEGQELDAKSGMGLGDGDTTSDAQDVSDRMESEDQLEDTLKPGESVESAEKDLKDEDKGVEMSEDFDGKQQDLDDKGGNKDNDQDTDSEDEKGEEELDKQMGDIDDPDAEKLDDQMWGGSSDEEDEDLNDKDIDKGKGSAQDTAQEMAAKDPSLEDAEPDTEKEQDQKQNEKKQKEINQEDDDDADLNDDQIDPFHGQVQPDDEPEPLDLPDDLNLDNAEANEKEPENEENPFDLDNCEKTDDFLDEKDDEQEPMDEDSNLVSEDEAHQDDPKKDLHIDVPDLDAEEDQDKGAQDAEEDLKELPEGDKQEEEEMEVVQDNPSEEQQKEDKSEPSEVPSGQTQDQTSTETEKAQVQKQKPEHGQSTKEENASKKDETESGQAESNDGSGHEGAKVKEDQQQIKADKNDEQSVSRKPGETDDNRSMIKDMEIPQTANRLKTLQNQEDKSEDNSVNPEPVDDEMQKSADLFQHIRDSQRQDTLTLDNATKEQADQQKQTSKSDRQEESEDNPDMDEADEELPSDQDEAQTPELVDSTQPAEKIRGKTEKREAHTGVEDMEVDVVVEGESVLTNTVQRPNTSTIETRLDLLEEWSRIKAQEVAEDELQKEILTHNPTYMNSSEESAALVQWHDLDSKTLHLAQELCEQLRLILEPTQTARLKGDYKTGKRLNMRKVIPYIASGFRKDKIWLRRTQPSKREYQIILALDDSASMADNQSKQMAFSAVAVVARSLGLLEAGQLAVVSFGEDCQLIHPFEEPFTDSSGARLLQRFTFNQRRTRIAQLLKSTSGLFAQAKESQSTSAASVIPELAQLLIIISDGRGVCHEGSETVKTAIRLVREQNIFVVFVIVDNPDNKDSILDIRLPIFANNNIVEIAKYMDYFPFPFYLILRDLSALPSVLSDALRQWFELVTSTQR